MDVTADAVLLPPHNQRDLRMRFEADQTVNDVAARLLKHLCPADVVLLVEAGLQLNQNHDLLAVLGGLCEGRDDRRITGDAVQGLLDGEYVRIDRSLCDKVDDWLEGLIWMMHENVAPADTLEYICSGRDFRNRLRLCVAMLFEIVKTLEPVHFHEESQVKRSVNPEHFAVRDGKFLLQCGEQPLINGGLHLETDCLAPLTAP